MKLFRKKVGPALKWIAGLFITYLLWGILDAIFRKQGLFETLFKTVPKKIFQIKVPDIVFAIFLIAIILFISMLYRRNGKRRIQGEQFDANKFLAERLKGKKLEFRDNAYWLEPITLTDKILIGLEGPFCTKCWDEKKELIHLHYSEKENRSWCPSCEIYGGIK